MLIPDDEELIRKALRTPFIVEFDYMIEAWKIWETQKKFLSAYRQLEGFTVYWLS